MVWPTAGGRGQWIKCPIPVTGLWDGGWKKGLLEAVHIAPLFTLTPGLREAWGGHMPNSTGGQSCPALSLTPLPAPLPQVRYMSARSLGCITDTETPLFSQIITRNCVCFRKLKSDSMFCDVDAVWIWVRVQKHYFLLSFAQNWLWFIQS